MKQANNFTIRLALAFTTLFFPLILQAFEIDQSSNIFKFQQKLASSGSATAQYKLATMYEMGDGVTADIEQAKHWYGLASDAGLKTAGQRETYLEVKERGFDKTKHSVWLDSVQQDAEVRKAEAVFLLAQLYRQGLGVDKDLNKSLELFKQVTILGNANAENQIVAIRNEIAQSKKTAMLKRQQVEQEKAQLVQAKADQKQQQQVAQQAKKEALAKTEEQIKAEKIRRYEEARMQMIREQQLIDEQQSWATGGAVATVDDEI